MPDEVIGHSVLPLLEGRTSWPRSAAIVGFHERTPGSDVGYAQAMDGKWSLTAWRGQRGPALHQVCEDPDCRRNAIKEHPSVVRRLRKAIRDFMARQRMDPDWVEGYDFRG
jgi:hypothetical protein